jgi:hypothetical protein
MTNKQTLRRWVQDAKIDPSDREQLFLLIDHAGEDNTSLDALERRITAALGGVVKSYQSKVPHTFNTK